MKMKMMVRIPTPTVDSTAPSTFKEENWRAEGGLKCLDRLASKLNDACQRLLGETFMKCNSPGWERGQRKSAKRFP